MKKLSLILSSIFIISSIFAQKTFDPRKGKKYFGGSNNEVKKLSNIGLQISLGPTFTLASLNKMEKSASKDVNLGHLGTYDIKPSGKIGANIEIGLAHYNMHSKKFSFGRIIDYFDYGVGFKYFRGTEKIDFSNGVNGEGKLANGYLNGRFSVHKLIYIKNSPLNIDNGLGINGDYLLLKKSEAYTNNITSTQKYSNPFILNLHYSLGIGIRLKRGSYLIPGVYVPILAFQEFGKESIQWFSSRYYPITCQVKLIKLLGKKSKKTDCSTNGSEEDKKKNKEFMQNK